jgi:hypothetical protein
MTLTMAEDVLGVKERLCLADLGQKKARPHRTMRFEAWKRKTERFLSQPYTKTSKNSFAVRA